MRRMYAVVGGGEVISLLEISLRSLMEFMTFGRLGRARDTHFLVNKDGLVRQP
jgi:hypothetical protein